MDTGGEHHPTRRQWRCPRHFLFQTAAVNPGKFWKMLKFNPGGLERFRPGLAQTIYMCGEWRLFLFKGCPLVYIFI